jgi:hypothetical protein
MVQVMVVFERLLRHAAVGERIMRIREGGKFKSHFLPLFID